MNDLPTLGKYITSVLLVVLWGWWTYANLEQGGSLIAGMIAVFGFAFIGMFLFFLLAPDVFRAVGKRIGKAIYYPTSGLETPEQLSRARKLRKDKKFEEAEEEYQKYIRQHPDRWKARRELASMYASEMENYGQALQELKKILELEVETDEMELEQNVRITLRNRIADLYGNRLNQPDKAEETLKEMIQELPDDHRDAVRAKERLKKLTEESG